MCADIGRRLRFAKFLWSKLLLLFFSGVRLLFE